MNQHLFLKSVWALTTDEGPVTTTREKIRGTFFSIVSLVPTILLVCKLANTPRFWSGSIPVCFTDRYRSSGGNQQDGSDKGWKHVINKKECRN